MPDKLIGMYNVSYCGVALPENQGWAAHLMVSGPSSNPMHRNVVYPDQRVAPDMIFATCEEAEQAALQFAEKMVQAAHDAPTHE